MILESLSFEHLKACLSLIPAFRSIVKRDTRYRITISISESDTRLGELFIDPPFTREHLCQILKELHEANRLTLSKFKELYIKTLKSHLDVWISYLKFVDTPSKSSETLEEATLCKNLTEFYYYVMSLLLLEGFIKSEDLYPKRLPSPNVVLNIGPITGARLDYTAIDDLINQTSWENAAYTWSQQPRIEFPDLSRSELQEDDPF